MPWVNVEVSARKLRVPRQCACCGVAVLDGSHTLTIPTAHRELRFSCCEHCLHHHRVWGSADPYSASVLAAWLAAAFIAEKSIVVALMFGAYATVGLLLWARRRRLQARALMTLDCACPQVPVRYLGESCTSVQLAFASAIYATAFARANRQWLVEVDPRVRAVADF